MEAYGLREAHPRAPTAHSHSHTVPHADVGKTYYDLTHHYPHTHEHLSPHLEHSHHHVSAQAEHEFHEKERKAFEDHWAVDRHHPLKSDFHPYKSASHQVAPHVRKHTDIEHYEIESMHAHEQEHHPALQFIDEHFDLQPVSEHDMHFVASHE